MSLIALRKSQQNHAAIDPWTVVHAGSGMAFGLLGVPFWPSLGAAVAYDILEQAVERTGTGKEFFKTSGPESVANVVVDTLVFLGCWYLGNQWNRT